MPITGQGWELLVDRLGVQGSRSRKRTYGHYQVFREGRPVAGLEGFMCECVGPGDNQHAGNRKRIEQGRYPLWTQFGRYRSIGYSTDLTTPGTSHMPGFRLEGVGKRDGILVHPAHPPKLYLSSIGCFNPTHALSASDEMDFWDSRARVIALLDDLRDFAPQAFAAQVMTRVPYASLIVHGEPSVAVAPSPAELQRMTLSAIVEPDSLPISKSAALQCAQWLMDNFGAQMRAATAGKDYAVKHLCAIVCQETAYKWLKWVGVMSTQTIIERCVFDASGDYPGTSRSAFPKDTAAFRARYGDQFTDILIEEANITRRLQGWSDRSWVYKGYGIFQYDLQKVKNDETFFRQKQWYSFANCLNRCCSELDSKLRVHHGDLWKAIKAYNGSGARAEQYMKNVMIFSDYCAEITG